MSSSENMAGLTVGSDTCYFAFWQAEGGHVPLTAILGQDKLAAKGVDGVRWIDDHAEFPQFRAITWEDFATFNAAVVKTALYESLVAKYGSLGVAVGTTTRVYAGLKIVAVDAKPMAGGLTGFGASSPSLARIEATWIFQMTATGTP